MSYVKYQAVNRVEEEINRHFDPRDLGSLVVLPKRTIEFSWGWIFYADTECFAATEESSASNATGPIAFSAAEGIMQQFPSYITAEQAAADFSAKLKQSWKTES